MTDYKTVQPILDFDWESLENANKFPGNRATLTNPADVRMKLAFDEYFGDKVLVEPIKGEIKTGTVISMNLTTATVDIDWRECAVIELAKEDKTYLDYIKPGYEIEVKIKDISDDGITASYTELIKHKKFQEIYESIGDETIAYTAKVKSLIFGGYFLDIDGIEVFMPGSQGGANKLVSFESLLGTEIAVCPISYSSHKGYIVVSHRKYLEMLIPNEIEKLEIGQEYTGTVTGVGRDKKTKTPFGIFAEFNECLTGLLPIANLDDATKELLASDSIKPGDSITYKLYEILYDNKLVYTQKEVTAGSKKSRNPWDNVEDNLTISSTVSGKITKKTVYGLFVEVSKGIMGLLHVSELDNIDDYERGDKIDVNIQKIDAANKRIQLVVT